MGTADQCCKIRIRLADGSELEAEGTAEFVERQRREFMERVPQGRAMNENGPAGFPIAAPHSGPSKAQPHARQGGQEGTSEPQISWPAVAETSNGKLQLRSKLTGKNQEHDACLTLLTAAEALLNIHKPTAGMLAKWLRASGYPIQRVDRAIQNAITKGEILASGSRRARRYELTAPGRLRGYLLAEQLTRLISGPSVAGNEGSQFRDPIWPK